MAIESLPKKVLPREKAMKHGVEILSDIELIALLLRTGTKNSNVLFLAEKLLEVCNGIENIVELDYDTIIKIKGIGKVKALEILGIVQLVNRINNIAKESLIYIENPEMIFKLYQKRYANEKQEHFIIIALDTKNAIIEETIVFIGTLQQSLVHPREIFNRLFIKSAASFICLHNHPSGNPKPSENDIAITKHLANVSNLMGIPLLDHIIIGRFTFFSFKEHNYL